MESPSVIAANRSDDVKTLRIAELVYTAPRYCARQQRGRLITVKINKLCGKYEVNVKLQRAYAVFLPVRRAVLLINY